MHKGAFRDALALRYGWDPPNTPSHCICGKSFTTEHALSCPFGGYPTLRHNEIRNLTANLLSEVCHNVTIEPNLQPVTRETFKLASTITDIGARSDIAADGFWGGHFEKTFFDVRVLNPLAPSNTTPTPSACYRRHEKEKPQSYSPLPCRPASFQMELILQPNHWMVAMPSVLFSPPFIHPMHQRSSFIKGARTLQCPSPCRASAGSLWTRKHLVDQCHLI